MFSINFIAVLLLVFLQYAKSAADEQFSDRLTNIGVETLGSVGYRGSPGYMRNIMRVWSKRHVTSAGLSGTALSIATQQTNTASVLGTLPTKDVSKHAAWARLDAFDCGESVADRIIGGKQAALGQFPWIARLGYDAYGDGDVDWLCGGALISDRHIITAAHCIDTTMNLTKVRLGEYDISKEPDCDGDVCAPAVQDRVPLKVLIHPQFQKPPFHNDIALIELDAPVTLHSYVAPVCLPRNAEHYKPLNASTLITVAGWGLTNMSTGARAQTLQVISIPLVLQSQCNLFTKHFVVADDQICAGSQKNKDSCAGDSGGPVMKVYDTKEGPKTYLIGVVSFGPSYCGITKPGIYVYLPKFLPWVLDNL